MDFLTGKIKPIYFKYLGAAFGSSLISSIYGVVDMAMVGQYQGPEGTAALAVVSPIWNIIYSLGLLMGIGGSVLFSTIRGESGQNKRRSNEYFSAALIGTAILAAITWLAVIFFDRELLLLFGAGLATVLGSIASLIIMCTHFFNKKNTLRFVRPTKMLYKLKSITVTGFSTFFIDVAMGILTVLFNRQILKYLSTDALSVYGIIINISTFVQCCAYSIGQAAQPIISTNYGAGKGDRIREVLKYAIGTAVVFGLIWTVAALTVPNLFIRIFMTPTESILQIAPAIIRSYGLSFLLLPFNIFSTYYFQSLIKPATSFAVSVARGAVISGILILLLPLIAPAASIWFAMPITELIVAVFVAVMMLRYTKELTSEIH